MESTFIYILKWAFCLAMLYIPFTLLLRQESFAGLNRRLLLCTVIASAILPAIVVRYTVEATALYEKQYLIANALHNTNLAVETGNTCNILTWENAAIIYLIGASIAFIWGVMGAIRTIARIKQGALWIDKQKEITIHCHINETASFSWFNHIVISENDYNECGTEILLHEKGHIHHKHSYDMLFIGVVKTLQWFNPFIYMLENDLKELHEYEADHYVLQNYTDTRAYQMLILKKSLNNKAIPLVNNFGTSSVRKRIMMLARNKESGTAQRAKWAYLVPITSLLLLFFAEPEYIYTTPAIKVIAETTPTITHKADIATTHKEPQKSVTSKAEKPKKQLPIANEALTQETTIESIVETPTTAVAVANKPTTQYAHKTYYECIELDNALAGKEHSNANIKKCSVRIQFTADKNGKANNITAKGCNISMSISDNKHGTIEDMQATIIATTTEYIESKEWALATIDGETIDTNYDAHIIFQNDAPMAVAAENNKRPLIIGSTPIY